MTGGVCRTSISGSGSLERYTGVCSRRVTVRYHVHEQQISRAKERMLAEHREVVKAHLARTGGSPHMLERWEATLVWDTLRAAMAERRWGAAMRCLPGLIANPQRPIGLVSQLWLRFRMRRRTSRLERDGGPSVAVAVPDRDECRAVLDVLRDRPVHDLSTLSFKASMASSAAPPGGRGRVGRASSERHSFASRGATRRGAGTSSPGRPPHGSASDDSAGADLRPAQHSGATA